MKEVGAWPWADGGYAAKLVTWAASKLKPKLTLENRQAAR
jgi:hypothetical protein